MDAHPLAGLLVGAMRADGSEHPAEHEAIERRLQRHGLGEALRGVALVEDLARQVRAHGARDLALRCASALPPELREEALAGVLEVIVADRRVSREEREYFFILAQALEAAA